MKTKPGREGTSAETWKREKLDGEEDLEGADSGVPIDVNLKEVEQILSDYIQLGGGRKEVTTAQSSRK